MITINIELGFESDTVLESNANICFVHCDPIEICLAQFTYAALDVEKYDNWWQETQPAFYIPRNLDEILENSFLSDPSLQHSKSVNKTGRLMHALMDRESIEIKCPILTEDFPSFQQGRHRFWLARELRLPFIIVAVSAVAYKKASEKGLWYSGLLRSRYIFDGHLEVQQDLRE